MTAPLREYADTLDDVWILLLDITEDEWTSLSPDLLRRVQEMRERINTLPEIEP